MVIFCLDSSFLLKDGADNKKHLQGNNTTVKGKKQDLYNHSILTLVITILMLSYSRMGMITKSTYTEKYNCEMGKIKIVQSQPS